MGFFGKLFSGISKAASTVANVASKVVDKAVEVASIAADKFISAAAGAAGWVAGKLGEMSYDSNSIDSRKGVEQMLADFRSEINEQAEDAEETCIYSAMSRFDEFADTLEATFPELVDLVRLRQEETEKMLTGTLIDYVQEHISENNLEFEMLLKMNAGAAKKKAVEEKIQSIIDDAQNCFGRQLKEQIKLLNDELNVRLDQKIKAQEKNLHDTEEKYKVLVKQQSEETLDIQKLEEECVPLIEAASCIQIVLSQEERKDEPMVRNRSRRPKNRR